MRFAPTEPSSPVAGKVEFCALNVDLHGVDARQIAACVQGIQRGSRDLLGGDGVKPLGFGELVQKRQIGSIDGRFPCAPGNVQLSGTLAGCQRDVEDVWITRLQPPIFGFIGLYEDRCDLALPLLPVFLQALARADIQQVHPVLHWKLHARRAYGTRVNRPAPVRWMWTLRR